MAAQAVHAATQVYLKNDGLRLLRELPDEVLQGLRYYETAATRAPFTPHAPLMGAPLGAQQFYHVVVTDWSLLVVDRGGGGSSILLEVPWLGIQDMVSSMHAAAAPPTMQPCACHSHACTRWIARPGGKARVLPLSCHCIESRSMMLALAGV